MQHGLCSESINLMKCSGPKLNSRSIHAAMQKQPFVTSVQVHKSYRSSNFSSTKAKYNVKDKETIRVVGEFNLKITSGIRVCLLSQHVLTAPILTNSNDSRLCNIVYIKSSNFHDLIQSNFDIVFRNACSL